MSSKAFAEVKVPLTNTYAFRFKDAKWEDVLDWYAEISGLTLITTVKPKKGTFTFAPPAGSKFTLGEITDIINGELVEQDFILSWRHKTFFIHPANERVVGPLPRVDLSELALCPKQEIIQVAIPLKKVKSADIAADAKKLLSPVGRIVELDKSNSLLVYDRVANLRDIIKLAMHAEEKAAEEPKNYKVNFQDAKWDDIFDWYAQISGLKADVQAKPKGTLTLKPGPDREFSVAEITDLLNETLAKQQLLMLPSWKSFVVLSTKEKIPSKFIPSVELRDLPTLPRTVVVEVAFAHNGNFENEDEIANELKRVLTPFGELLVFKGRWIILRETVGNILRIREILSPTSQR